MVAIEALEPEDQNIIRMYTESHFEKTNSKVAKNILDNWAQTLPKFIKVMPQDFKRALASRNVSIQEVLKDKTVVYKDIKIEVNI